MAKSTSSGTNEAAKEPGRIAQIRQVTKMTVKHDAASRWIFLAAFLLPVIAAIVLAATLYLSNWLMWILLLIVGVLLGLLFFMFALNWRAEKVAFQQIDGRTGAAGQVLNSQLRGAWVASDMPVAFNPKTQDCVFRAIGKPGIVFVTEGHPESVKRLLADERRKTQRVAPNVPIHHVHVGSGPDEVKLGGLRRALGKLPGSLTKPEIQAIANRLSSLKTNQMPIPKGIDPMRVRPSRKAMR